MSILHYYIATVILVSLLPAALLIKLPEIRLLTHITPPSSYNFDTGENNQFTLIGHIANYKNTNVFLAIYQKNNYQFKSLKFDHFDFVKLAPTDSNGYFEITGLNAGDYLIRPKSLPLQHIFFAQKYYLTLADHNPKSLIITPPTSSVFQFAVDMFHDSP